MPAKFFRTMVLLLCILLLPGCQRDKALTEEEIASIEAIFYRENSRAFTCMLLSSEYAAPQEIDLGWLFREGVPNGDGWGYPVSEEELAALRPIVGEEDWPYYMEADHTKIPRQVMDELLRQYLGLGLEETDQIGLDDLIYLPEYDAYYGAARDTQMVIPDITSGVRREDGTLELRYHYEWTFQEDDTHVMVLRPTEDGYLFVSNLPIEKAVPEHSH